MKNCAFTGHRVISPRHRDRISDLIERAINYAYNLGCRNFIAGGAIGFDTLCAREIIKFRMEHNDVRLLLYLPCQNQDKNWSEAQKDAYGYILNLADEIKYVSDEYSNSCMKERNESLARDADILIAYVSRNYSGAAQTARMAERLGKTVYNIYPSLERI